MKVEIKPDSVVVTGPKGTVTNVIPPGIRWEKKDKELLPSARMTAVRRGRFTVWRGLLSPTRCGA